MPILQTLVARGRAVAVVARRAAYRTVPCRTVTCREVTCRVVARAFAVFFGCLVGVHGAAPLALAQTGTSGETPSTRLRTSFRVFPAPLWSRTAGFSAGIGYEIKNAIVRHDRFLVAARPGQHLGRYAADYSVRDPRVHVAYGRISAYYETAGRQWYYGTGPASRYDDRTALEKEAIEIGVRGGVHALGRRVFIQPSWAYLQHRSHNVRDWNAGAYDRLSTSSRAQLDASLGETSGASARQRGMSIGAAAGVDLRDRPVRTRYGLLVQATARRFLFHEPDGLEFDRYSVGAFGYVPLARHVLALRAVLERTEAPETLVIPFYLLPVLDGHLLPGYAPYRFFGRDLLVLTAEYRVPVFQFRDVASLDALLSMGAGSVYDDIGEQFEASISFDDTFDEGRRTYPLRPSAAIGFDFESDATFGWNLRALLGMSAEGLRIVTFGFIHDLQGGRR